MRGCWKTAAGISLASIWRMTNSLLLSKYCLLPIRRRSFVSISSRCFATTKASPSLHTDADALPSSSSSRLPLGKDLGDDSDKRVFLPHRENGYRIEPFSWAELDHILHVEQNMAKLGRSVHQQVDYELYKRATLREWNTLLDKVLCDKFEDMFTPEQQQEPASTSSKWVARPPLASIVQETPGKNRTCLVPNEFPYYTESDIEHWVLWKIGSGCTIDDVQLAQRELWDTGRYHTNDDDSLWWINPPHLRSLPEIDHAHILVRRKSSPLQLEDG